MEASDSCDGACLKPIVLAIAWRAERIGLKVHVVVSDMSRSNQAIWRALPRRDRWTLFIYS